MDPPFSRERHLHNENKKEVLNKEEKKKKGHKREDTKKKGGAGRKKGYPFGMFVDSKFLTQYN